MQPDAPMLPCSQKMEVLFMRQSRLCRVFLTVAMITVIAVLALSGCRAQPAPLQDALADYEKVLKTDGLDGLRLSVYYIDPSILTRSPLTEEQLLSFESVQKFEVDNAQLLQHIELLKTINAEELTPVSNPSALNARLCCIFESDYAGQVLQLTLGGEANSIFVNGVEAENCELLHDLLAAFAPEEVLHVLNGYFAEHIEQ